jgi:hypothetical protein
MKPYYLIFNTKNKLVGGCDFEDAYRQISQLEINISYKEMLKQKIYTGKDFEISTIELQTINIAFENRIDKLLKDKDFNPFKEELRKRFPTQYGSQPFEYKGTTYYLYSKGFPIDELISRTIIFKNLVEEHINANMPLKYVYKE